MSSNRARKREAAGEGPVTQSGGVKESGGGRKTTLIIAGILVLLFAFALFLRVFPPFKEIFSPYGIKFSSNDSYFFMNLVDNLVKNFPHHTHVNPYLQYPLTGSGGVVINFFVWLTAVPAWIIGLGSASQRLIDITAVWQPAILGALCLSRCTS